MVDADCRRRLVGADGGFDFGGIRSVSGGTERDASFLAVGYGAKGGAANGAGCGICGGVGGGLCTGDFGSFDGRAASGGARRTVVARFAADGNSRIIGLFGRHCWVSNHADEGCWVLEIAPAGAAGE